VGTSFWGEFPAMAAGVMDRLAGFAALLEASSIFSLKNEPEGGSGAIRRKGHSSMRKCCISTKPWNATDTAIFGIRGVLQEEPEWFRIRCSLGGTLFGPYG
jgi:hypothetical protein